MQEPVQSGLGDEDFPDLYRVADQFSIVSQTKYLRLLLRSLLALIAGALCTVIPVDGGEWRRAPFAVGAALMAFSLYWTLMVAQKSYRERWYGGRAIAESVKTYAWRYMMRAEPFAHADTAPAEQLFLDSLRGMIAQEALKLTGPPLPRTGEQITRRMREIRTLGLADRRQTYLEYRVRDQRAWYSGKAADNARKEDRLFSLVGLAQLAALVTAISLAAMPSAVPNLVGVFAASSASLLAWLQAKRHEDLAQSYSVAAQELGLIEAQAAQVTDDEAFSTFVADSEAAISREHTLWLARRDSGTPGIIL